MEIKELKSLVAQKIKEYPEYKERALYELRRAIWLFESKWWWDNYGKIRENISKFYANNKSKGVWIW